MLILGGSGFIGNNLVKAFSWSISYDLFQGIKEYHEGLKDIDTMGHLISKRLN
ncbi:MAG: hypothetical protein RPR97_17470 [Colwellia sp.]|jgi:hypothetical protein